MQGLVPNILGIDNGCFVVYLGWRWRQGLGKLHQQGGDLRLHRLAVVIVILEQQESHQDMKALQHRGFGRQCGQIQR